MQTSAAGVNSKMEFRSYLVIHTYKYQLLISSLCKSANQWILLVSRFQVLHDTAAGGY